MNNVINLSTKLLTIYEFKLLNKNLSFCPTPNWNNKKQFRNDINAFISKIKLQARFKNIEQSVDGGQFRVSRNKIQAPKENNHTVGTFAKVFQNDLEKEEQILEPIPHSTLSKKEKDALKTLSKREDIIITKADEGGAVVITDADDYV